MIFLQKYNSKDCKTNLMCSERRKLHGHLSSQTFVVLNELKIAMELKLTEIWFISPVNFNLVVKLSSVQMIVQISVTDSQKQPIWMNFNNVHVADTTENIFSKLVPHLNDILGGKSPAIILNHGTTGKKIVHRNKHNKCT